jgi:hypothetical protein
MAQYYAQVNPEFQPAMRNILSITNANPCVITTTFDGINPGNHLYQSGLIVRIIIPYGFGMNGLDKQTGTITVLSPTTFSFPFDTTNLDSFVIPPNNPGHFFTPAQCTAIGEKNDILIMSVENILLP